MKIEKIVNGFLEENCYLIINKENECLIVDPGDEGEKITTHIRNNNYNVIGILITHYHFDHIGALEHIKKAFNITQIIDYQKEGKQKISNFEFQVIKTPGHTLDSVSFYFDTEYTLFTGDFVFKETIGNYEKDNELVMAESLEVFKNMSEQIKIYPGHGEESTVAHEIKYNPYMKGL